MPDQRQAILDPIGKRGTRRRQQRPEPEDGVVVRGDGDERQRLAREVAHAREQLTPRAPALRIDRRPDQHERPRSVGPPDRELRHDLAAERVRYQRRPLDPERVEAAGERVGQRRDTERRLRALAAPVARQVGNEDREPAFELPREREHVRPRDAEPVHEHDGLTRAAGRDVDTETVHDDPLLVHAQSLEMRGHRSAPPKRTDALRFRTPWHQDRARHEAALDRATADVPAHTVIALDADELRALSAVFSAPRWLRDLGIAAWLLVGVTALLVGLTWILGLTSTITEPVLCGLVIATVASPAVGWLEKHRWPRAAGAAVMLLLLVALGAVIVLLVVGGIKGQSGNISAQASVAADKFQSWLTDLGVQQSGASTATSGLESSVPDVISTFVHGVAAGISGLTSIGFFLAFLVFSLFMLLKDGPKLRDWANGHLGVPDPVAKTITRNVILSIRRYFLGTTIVAGFNAVVVGLGALILGVPLAGTIAVVTLVTAYIPFVGAFVSGAFAVVLALGSKGTTTALIMLVIVILANGALQNVVQPIAMGATLRMNPLLILVVTISAGAFFGMAGMILAAPLTSAAMHISRDLARVRAASPPPPEQAAVPAPQ